MKEQLHPELAQQLKLQIDALLECGVLNEAEAEIARRKVAEKVINYYESK